jgi:uncharacterized protein YecE (DUF72 family)
VSAEIRLGCQGWTYPDWVGVFYPPGAKQEHLLPFYAQVFNTVELDNTFYRIPRPTLVRAWASHTPPHFRFAAKVPREISHDSGLRGVGEAMERFVQAMEPLGEKLGPILVQLPASFECGDATARDVQAFLDSTSRDVRLAVEFRHTSWHQERIYELLRERGVSLAWTEWRTLPSAREVTADFLYLRWLGNRSDIRKYDRTQIDRGVELEDWEKAMRGAVSTVENMYGYFNNHWAGHSPSSVNELLRRLGQPSVEPRNLWPQKELF